MNDLKEKGTRRGGKATERVTHTDLVLLQLLHQHLQGKEETDAHELGRGNQTSPSLQRPPQLHRARGQAPEPLAAAGGCGGGARRCRARLTSAALRQGPVLRKRATRKYSSARETGRER